MSKAKKRSLPKPRTRLHEVLAMKATSNASGKHTKQKARINRKIERLIEYGDH